MMPPWCHHFMMRGNHLWCHDAIILWCHHFFMSGNHLWCRDAMTCEHLYWLTMADINANLMQTFYIDDASILPKWKLMRDYISRTDWHNTWFRKVPKITWKSLKFTIFNKASFHLRTKIVKRDSVFFLYLNVKTSHCQRGLQADHHLWRIGSEF